jgi:hypothetical protein
VTRDHPGRRWRRTKPLKTSKRFHHADRLAGSELPEFTHVLRSFR